MLCEIAELIVDVPAAGGLAPRCKDYLYNGDRPTQIRIRETDYRPDRYPEGTSPEMVAYMESAYQFYLELLDFDGFYIHASAVVLDGYAWLFSGPCGVGKSTHTRLWQETFPGAYVINDDKPALRFVDGTWYAYGTPWCGKSGINRNEKFPLGGLCFLAQAQENRIRRQDSFTALQKILSQTIHRLNTAERMGNLVASVDSFLSRIPVYEMENLPQSAAAKLSYETMRAGAQEMGL